MPECEVADASVVPGVAQLLGLHRGQVAVAADHRGDRALHAPGRRGRCS